MPSPSTSTFMKRSASMSSLSHSITWRSSIAAGSIGTSSSSRSSGQHEAAGMLRQVAREADQLARQIQGQAQPAVVEVEVQLGGLLLGHAFLAPAPDLRRPARR